MAEIYVSTDCETDGPIPGPHSMLSFASAAMTDAGAVVGTFEANLEPLPGAAGDPKTMAWWDANRAAYDQTRRATRDPAEAMRDYAAWLGKLPGKPVFVAYPAGFDFTFVYWYLVRFTGGSPFSHSALDIKTLAMAALGCGYRDATKRNMPRAWFDAAAPHTHVALDDAVEQGKLFVNVLKAVRGR